MNGSAQSRFDFAAVPSDQCERCPALCASRTRIVPYTDNRSPLLVIGEAPGAEEDAVGDGFVGRAGKTLDAVLKSAKVDRHQYSRANVCQCRPEGNRKPSQAEIDNCLPRLADFIRNSRPKVILAIGATPSAVFFGKQALFELLCNTPQGFDSAHPALREVLTELRPHVVPCVHTSALSWNRNAPNGQKWSVLGTNQIHLAAQLAFSSNTPPASP